MCSPISSALQSPATLRRHVWYPERASRGLRGRTTQGRASEFSPQPVQQFEAMRQRPVLKFQPARVQAATRRGLPHPLDPPAPSGAKPEWETGPEVRTQEHPPSDRGDGTGDRAGHRSWNGSEECSVGITEYRHNKCTVQVVIPHFAGSLSHQRAAVAGSTMEPAALQTLTRHMVGADWIVRTERAHPERLRKMILDVARLLHKTTEGPVSIGAPCVEQNAKMLGLGIRVDPLSNRTSGVAAAHGERLDEEMRECVQQHIRSTREWALALPVLCPVLVSSRERIEALLHGCSRKPTHHCLRTKLDEQPLTTVLDCGEPRWFAGDLRSLDVGLVFAVDVRRHSLEAMPLGSAGFSMTLCRSFPTHLV